MSGVADVIVGVDLGSARVKAAVAGPGGDVRVVRFHDVAWLVPMAQVADHDAVAAASPARQAGSRGGSGRVFDPTTLLTRDPPDGAGAGDAAGQAAADVVAAVFRTVLEQASGMAGRPGVVRVVVPAGWGPRRRTRMRAALHRAGVGDPELIEAPVAVVWHLAAGGVTVADGECVVVCDFGAGFTASVVQRTGDGFDVLATISAPAAGGVMVDRAVAAAIDATCRAASGDAPAADPGSAVVAVAELHADDPEVLDRARSAKEALSTASTAVVPAGSAAVVFDVPQLARAAGPAMAAAVAATRQAITAADVAVDDVRWVVCVGGGARMPIVADAFEAGLGVRPVLVTHADHAAVFGAVQAPHRPPDPAGAGGSGGSTGSGASPDAVDGVTALLAAVASVGLWAQFLAGAQRYGPRQSIVPGMLLAYWGGLAVAAVLAVVAGAAGASWLSGVRHASIGDVRLRRRLFGVVLAGGAVAGLAVAAGYAMLAAGFFDVPAGPLLRWSVLAALPTAVLVLLAAGVVVWRPDPPGGWWPAWFRFPVATVVLAAVGTLLVGYDVTGVPWALAPLRWWLEQNSAASEQIVGVTGRLGGGCIGAAVGLLLARRWWHQLFVAVPVAALTAAATSWRSTGLVAAGFAAVVAGWWLWRLLALLTHDLLHPTAPTADAATATPAAAAAAEPGGGPAAEPIRQPGEAG